MTEVYKLAYQGMFEIKTIEQKLIYINQVDLDDYKLLNHEWKIIATSGTHHVKKYDCCVEEYHDIEFELTLQRSSPAYKSIIILPAYSKQFAQY